MAASFLKSRQTRYAAYAATYILVVLASALLFLGYARVGASPEALQAAVQAPPKAKEETS